MQENTVELNRLNEPRVIGFFEAKMDYMAEISKSCRHWPTARETGFLLALSSMGLLGNYLNIELFFGVNFLFGSIATMIAVRMSGAIWGTLVGIVIGSYSYVLWGHPYAIIIFGLEAFVVGVVACCLKKDDLLLIDVGYWLLVGFPLVWVFYYFQLGLPEPAVILIGLKQMANGIVNVVLASLFFQSSLISEWINSNIFAGTRKKVPLKAVINSLLAGFILLPILAVTIVSGRGELTAVEAELKRSVKEEVADSTRELTSNLHHYSAVLSSMAAVDLDKDIEALERTIDALEENVVLGLLNTEILGADGETLFSYPEQRSGISEYASQISSTTSNSPYISRVHADGGLNDAHFTMIAPISAGRFLAASFSPNVFGGLLTRIAEDGHLIELIDGRGHIIATSGGKDLSGFVRDINPHHLLPSNAELPTMVRWRQSYWEATESFSIDNDWTIRVAIPMKRSIEFLEADYIQKFVTMLIISLVGLLCVPFVSRRVSSPLEGLTRAAEMFTHKLERVDVIWPTSNINEVDLLVDQFQRFFQEINKKQMALSQSEAQYSGIVETASDAIISIDKNHDISLFNAGAEKIFGFTSDEVIGRQVTELMPENFRDHHSGYVDQFSEEPQTARKLNERLGVLGMRKNGEKFAASAAISKLLIGDKTTFTIILQDVSEREKFVQENIQRAAEMTLLIDSANAPIFGVNAKLQIDEWNKAAALATGYHKGEVLGCLFIGEFITDEDKDVVGDIFSDALAGIETANIELHLKGKNGRILTVLFNTSTRRGLDGSISGVIGIGQDITEVKRLQLETERSAAELTQLIDSANAPIFSTDSDGLVIEWNQAIEDLSGYPKEEILGANIIKILFPDDQERYLTDIFITAMTGEGVGTLELQIITREGEKVELLLNLTTRVDWLNNIVGVFGVGQDVTLLREKEFSLQQSQKMEAVGRLTGGIAHDFNNLLSVVQGNLRFLQEDIGETDDDIKLLFEDAFSAVEDGSELTGRLLRFSNNRNLQPIMQGVNVTIEKFYRLISRTIGEKISLELKLAEEELYVRVDPSQLDNSLLNLVINARDAMPKGGEIIIMAELISYTEAKRVSRQYDMNDSPNQEFVKISVHDKGEGIGPDIIDRITEPFYTTKEVGAGTGLGLSMVYSFMRTSGGFLRINSTVGKGTIVEMYFPSMKGLKNALVEEIATSSESILSKTILVVEDEPRVRRVSVRTLRGLSYKTIEAENAAMAISIIESGEEIDLVFSDILMPGDMDGRMLGDWVKEHYPAIKVVLTSGYSKGKSDVKTPLGDENLTKYPIVRKPYRLNALADIIQGEFEDN